MVEGVLAAAEDLAGIAMAVGRALVLCCSNSSVAVRWLPENVRSIVNLGGPFGLAAMALSVVGRHVCWYRAGGVWRRAGKDRLEED